LLATYVLLPLLLLLNADTGDALMKVNLLRSLFLPYDSKVRQT